MLTGRSCLGLGHLFFSALGTLARLCFALQQGLVYQFCVEFVNQTLCPSKSDVLGIGPCKIPLRLGSLIGSLEPSRQRKSFGEMVLCQLPTW